jgi:hypothetical protein
LRFGAASRVEASEKRVPRYSSEAATAGWFELSFRLFARYPGPNLFPPITTRPSGIERSSPVHIQRHTVRVTSSIPLEETMKLRFALAGLVALGGAALGAGTASAMPLAPLSPIANVESVALVCGPNGCIRTRPVVRYGGYGYGVRRGGYAYGVRRGGYAYGYRRGYRRW